MYIIQLPIFYVYNDGTHRIYSINCYITSLVVTDMRSNNYRLVHHYISKAAQFLPPISSIPHLQAMPEIGT